MANDNENDDDDSAEQLLMAEAARHAAAKPSSQFVHAAANANAGLNGYHNGGTIPAGAQRTQDSQ